MKCRIDFKLFMSVFDPDEITTCSSMVIIVKAGGNCATLFFKLYCRCPDGFYFYDLRGLQGNKCVSTHSTAAFSGFQ